MNRSFNKSQSLRYLDCSAVEVKSKYGAEFRRFSVDRFKPGKFEEFYKLILHIHRINNTEVMIGYADIHGDLLPINNDDNFCKAVSTAHPLLRIFIQRQEEVDYSNFGTNTLTRRKKPVVNLRNDTNRKRPHIRIGMPQDFRPVSSIIDVDILPESHRRVRLYRHGSDKPLGFYIRDGTSVRVTPHGLEKVPGIFISRMVPGGLAESTGLLAVNDEVLEVNGIEVTGKTLDQVTDMMIANSHNLIVTVKPVNQRNNIVRGSRISGSSGQSTDSSGSSAGYPSLAAAAGAHGFAGDELESDEESDIVIESSVKRPSRRSNASVASATSRSHGPAPSPPPPSRPTSVVSSASRSYGPAPSPPPSRPTSMVSSASRSHGPAPSPPTQPRPASVVSSASRSHGPAPSPPPPSRPTSVVSAASFHSQASLNGSAPHAGLSFKLHRDLTLQPHHSSNPALRESNGSLHKILSTMRTDPRHSLALPRGGVEEDGTVITL